MITSAMSDSAPVTGHIPLLHTGIPSPNEIKVNSSNSSATGKRNYRKYSDSSDEKESKKRHKKSKKKDKHKDKEKEKSKDKKKEKKHTNEPELTAIEKFNMFKKQREAGKGDDKIVDDLFKDFIASKLKQIESDNIKSKDKRSKSKKDKDETVSSVDEMSKFLDKEINNIALPSVSKDLAEKPASPPDKVKSVAKLTNVPASLKPIDNVKSALPVRKSVIDNPTTLGSLLKLDKRKENITANKSSVIKEPDIGSDIPLRKEKDLLKSSQVISDSVIPLPVGPSPTQEGGKTASTDKDIDDSSIQKDKTEKDLPVFGPMLPRSIAIGEKRDNTEEQKIEVKKLIGFKNFGIKLSATSAELIQSGEVHKKGKRLEEGEVLSSSSEGSDSSDSEPDDDDDDENEVSGTGSISDSDGESKSGSKSKKKKKKKKKAKHKKKKKHKEKDKEKDGVVVVGKDKPGSKRKVSITPRSRSRSPKKSRRSRSHSYSRDRSRRRSRSRSRDRGRSRRSRSRSRGRRSRSRGRRSRSRGRRSRSRSKSPDRFWRSKYGDFDAYKFLKGKKDRSRSRSPDRERDRFIEKEKKRLEDLRLRIDKAKLREIAIKNAVTNARSGGPQLDVAIKSGGKSVEELTEYCKKIQEKEIQKKKSRNEYESSSDEEPIKHSDDEDLVHHPFLVKEAGAIVVDIKNSKQLPVVSPQERITQNAQLRITYPVSSGSQHRDKEWVPVEPGPVPPPKPKTNTVGGIPALMPPPAPPKPKPDIKVFEEPPEQQVDISSIVSERLTAMKKLQENPNDTCAKIILSKAQEQASRWAASKNLPGQFIGSTGVNILSQEELMGNRKRQAWLKKDVFTSAAPVTGGIGMFLLQKMGWKHGEGLGKNNEGNKEPLMLDFKIDRKGLVTEGEGKKSSQPKIPRVKDLSGKHPVSALGELCNKKHWGPPHYELVHESGPAHKKDFLFKVKVNGIAYQPSVASNNKKLAKAQSATVCLQELGLVPRNIAAP